MSEPLAYDRRGAAAAVSVSVDTITRAINTGKLTAYRTGADAEGNPAGKYVIGRDDLIAWFKGLHRA